MATIVSSGMDYNISDPYLYNGRSDVALLLKGQAPTVGQTPAQNASLNATTLGIVNFNYLNLMY